MPIKRIVRSGLFLIAIATVGFLAVAPAGAQTATCKTPNCMTGTTAGPILPPECLTKVGSQPLASPRVFVVKMDSSLHFIPQNPRLEGQNSTITLPWDYQCIEWHKTGTGAAPWHSATDSTALSACNNSQTCSTSCPAGSCYPNPCDFETGNINTGAGGLEWGSCHYKDIPIGAYPYECRLHVSLGMTGTLTIVQPIVLTATKSGANVNLTWTGGSASGPWDVFRDATPGLAQKMATPNRLSPTTGQTTRTFSDTACAPTPGNLCSYMIRECNKDANTGNLCI